MKRVLITGANGFCGQYLSKYLTASGTYRVFGGGLQPSSSQPLLKTLAFDITQESQTAHVIKKLKPDFVCHLAAQSNARLSPQMQSLTYQVNTAGTIHLLRSVRQYTPHTRVLFVSSVHVYGRHLRHSNVITEGCSFWPESPYGLSKALAELAAADFSSQFGLDIITARTNNLFGPGQSPDYVFSDWCRQIARIEKGLEEPIILVGDLELKRDFLSVYDAISAYENLLRLGRSGEYYNVSSGHSASLRGYLEFLINQSKVKIKIKVDLARLRNDDPTTVRVSSEKLRSLGWRPQYPVKNSLLELLSYWRRRVDSE